MVLTDRGRRGPTGPCPRATMWAWRSARSALVERTPIIGRVRRPQRTSRWV
jgi:hypothetical protein